MVELSQAIRPALARSRLNETPDIASPGHPAAASRLRAAQRSDGAPGNHGHAGLVLIYDNQHILQAQPRQRLSGASFATNTCMRTKPSCFASVPPRRGPFHIHCRTRLGSTSSMLAPGGASILCRQSARSLLWPVICPDPFVALRWSHLESLPLNAANKPVISRVRLVDIRFDAPLQPPSWRHRSWPSRSLPRTHASRHRRPWSSLRSGRAA